MKTRITTTPQLSKSAEEFRRAIHLATADYAHREWLERVRAGKKRGTQR